MPPEEQTEDVVSLSEYLSILANHKGLIIFFLLTGFAAALFFALTAQPQYQATAKLVVKSPSAANAKNVSLTDESGAVDTLFFREFTLNTHLDLILSHAVLEKLIEKLNLDQKNIEETSGLRFFVKQVKSNFHLLLNGEEKVLSPIEKKYLLAEALKQNISVKNPKLTDILTVTVQGADPQQASAIANTLANLYIQHDIAINQLASGNSFTFLKDQAADFKIKLDQAEEEFIAYKQKENMFSLETMQRGVEEKKKAYDAMLLDARSKQQQLALRLNELEAVAGDQKNYTVRLRSLIGNPVIENLNNQLISAEIEQSKLSKIYRSKHAEMQAVQSTINDIRSELSRQIEKEISSMKKEREMLLASIDKTQSLLEDLKKEAMGMSSKEKQYLILEDKVKTYKKYYETLASKIEDVSVSSEIRNAVTNISLVEQAQTPIYPVKPNKSLIVVAGIVGGLCSGIALALLLDFSDRTIRTEEEAKTFFDLPVIGIIPVISQKTAGCRSSFSADNERKAA